VRLKPAYSALINAMVALNLNIRQFAQDVIQFCQGPELLRAIWKVIEKDCVIAQSGLSRVPSIWPMRIREALRGNISGLLAEPRI
jgi:hypothetical protein